jgi:signal transduction histidine kinase
MLGIPLLIKNQVYGGISLYFRDLCCPLSAEDAAIAMSFADQAALAIENARLYAQASDLASLEERQRLARELHDSVSQALYGIQLGAQTARELLNDDTPDLDLKSALVEPLDYVLSLAEAGLAEMRALIFELRPESLKLEGLVGALTKQANALRVRHHLQVEIELGDEPDVALEVKETLYRIAQEALHNIVKHARATRVALRLNGDAEMVELSINDNGAGFDASGTFPGHLGLRSMRERATRVDGTLDITSAPKQGTRIGVRIPKTRKIMSVE